jgi:uncharacterized membrane protein YqgA involved in biofilm formation
MSKLLEKYGENKTSRVKLIALCIKAVTGVLGASLVLEQNHPYLAITVLAIGAVINEIINFYKWN